jgi:DNA-binding NarL/FixJ family response regulator
MSDKGQLSPGQWAILKGLASGLSVKELASNLGLTAKSVDSHRYRLMNRLGLHSRIELTQYAIENGIVQVMALDDAPEPSQLTSRQREAVALTGAGLSVKEMAGLLQISTRAADAHKYRAMHRLDLHDSVRLVHYCAKHQLTMDGLARSSSASGAWP